MALEKYISACRKQLRELKESLSDEDRELLYDDCMRLERRGWQWWCYEHENEVTALVAKKPTAAGKRKMWQDPITARRMILAAIQHTYRALHLLEGIDEAGLRPVGDSRSMAAAAGRVYNSIFFDRGCPEWPFDESNPFDV